MTPLTIALSVRLLLWYVVRKAYVRFTKKCLTSWGGDQVVMDLGFALSHRIAFRLSDVLGEVYSYSHFALSLTVENTLTIKRILFLAPQAKNCEVVDRRIKLVMTWTELHDACVHQELSLVIQLAKLHADQANEVDDHGLTPLHLLIVGSPSVDAVKELLQAFPMAASQRDVHGDTPLHLAAGCPDMTEEIVKLLLDAYPPAVSLKNREGLMPLHMACRYANQNENSIKILIAAFPDALRVNIKVRIQLFPVLV